MINRKKRIRLVFGCRIIVYAVPPNRVKMHIVFEYDPILDREFNPNIGAIDSKIVIARIHAIRATME